MPPAYRPDEHEPRARERWTRSNAFAADPAPVLSGKKKPYCVLIPPPNITARLHLGHALNNTIQDVLVRRHRMMGRETLWMPGADHAGIATQTVVEKKLLATEGKKRTDYEREEFLEKVFEWKDQYEGEIRDQLLTMGCSCDWDRYRFTMDEQCARAVREAFFRLFKEGLIERGKRLVNWDPVTLTALADDEVEMKEVQGHFYYLRYPLTEPVNAPDGATWKHVTVATTRPETYLGDTAVAINPKDSRAEFLVGKTVTLPIVGREIPIIADEYVVMPADDPDAPGVEVKAKYATGFLKVTPAHDPNDWEIGRRHNLPVINVMAPDATISDQHGWDDASVESREFVGMSREDARKATVAKLDELGLVEKVVDYTHSVGHSYRSHAPIEPYLSDQWYVKVTDDRLRGAAQRALAADQRTTDTFPADTSTPGDGAMRFHPDRYAKTYESWHDNLRDWCISRQLWWGHRIPVWAATADASEHAEKLDRWANDGRVCWVSEVTDDGASRLSVCVRDENDDEIAKDLEACGFQRDPDVLDTWFSSALWPLSTLGWPDDTDLLKAFNPTDVLCTARDIITLWVSRMVMFNRLFKGQGQAGGGQPDEPFHDVYIHAMIQDGEGRRMSKSLGNGVDPLDIIHSHGADAMRFTLCQMTTQTQDVRLPVERDEETGRNTSPKFDLGKRFCNKLWNASRFTMMMLAESAPDASERELTLADRWMLSRLSSACEAANKALDEYQFSAYAETLYDLLWRDFCDWYLEAVKPTVKTNRTQQAILRASLDAILRLLHPACPFVTEAIYEHLRAAPRVGEVEGPLRGIALDESDLLCTAAWPEIDPNLQSEDAEKRFDEIRSLIEAIREARASQGLSHKVALTLHAPGELARRLVEAGGLAETIANLEAVTTEAPNGPALVLPFEGRELHLTGHAASAEDASAQRERLEKQIGDLTNSIKALEGRLKNPGYVQKAPEKLVNETRAQLKAQQDELAAAKAALAELS